MATTRITSYTSATNAVAGSTPTRLSKVRVTLAPTASATVFIQLFDNAAPTLGTTTPNDVLEVPLSATQSAGSKMMHSVVFPGGGKRYATALSFGCTTTYNGATGSSGANAPLAVDLFWEPGS